MSWSYAFSCFEFVELFIEIVFPTMKIHFGTKIFGKAFLQSPFCLKLMRDHPFSMYAKFSKKLTFLTLWYAPGGSEMLVFWKIFVRTKWINPEGIQLLIIQRALYLRRESNVTLYLLSLIPKKKVPCLHFGNVNV